VTAETCDYCGPEVDPKFAVPVDRRVLVACSDQFACAVYKHTGMSYVCSLHLKSYRYVERRHWVYVVNTRVTVRHYLTLPAAA
jgi:hypothetical protein